MCVMIESLKISKLGLILIFIAALSACSSDSLSNPSASLHLRQRLPQGKIIRVVAYTKGSSQVQRAS